MNQKTDDHANLLFCLKEANHKIDLAHEVAMENEWTGTMQDLASAKSTIVGLMLNVGDHLTKLTT